MNEIITELQNAYNELCQRVEPWQGAYSFLTVRGDNGGPHVEFVDDTYHYITTERGLELERKSTQDRDEILYWLLSDITFWMAVQYEVKNRVDGQDVRRIMFAKWQELMDRAGPELAGWLRSHIADILSANPFDDSLF